MLGQVQRGASGAPRAAPSWSCAEDPTFHEFASEWSQPAATSSSRRPTRHHTWTTEPPPVAPLRAASAQRDHDPGDRPLQAVKVREASCRGQREQDADVARGDPRRRCGVRPDLAQPVCGTGRRKLKVTRSARCIWTRPNRSRCCSKPQATSTGRNHARTSGQAGAVATLVFAGLRVSEACALRWADVDLVTVGLRSVSPRPRPGCARSTCCPVAARRARRLQALPHEHRPRRPGLHDVEAGTRVDRTTCGAGCSRPSPSVQTSSQPKPGHAAPLGLTAHKLRHTFASILAALGTSRCPT